LVADFAKAFRIETSDKTPSVAPLFPSMSRREALRSGFSKASFASFLVARAVLAAAKPPVSVASLFLSMSRREALRPGLSKVSSAFLLAAGAVLAAAGVAGRVVVGVGFGTGFGAGGSAGTPAKPRMESSN
jgi:hypothetical protein